MRTQQDIIKEIRALLSELEGTSPSTHSKASGAKNMNKKDASNYSGCMGGIMYLVDNSFFASPKDRAEVISELQKEGWHYSGSLVSMNLLSLTRQRVLTRIKGDKASAWKYVIRK